MYYTFILSLNPDQTHPKYPVKNESPEDTLLDRQLYIWFNSVYTWILFIHIIVQVKGSIDFSQRAILFFFAPIFQHICYLYNPTFMTIVYVQSYIIFRWVFLCSYDCPENYCGDQTASASLVLALKACNKTPAQNNTFIMVNFCKFYI